MLQSWAIDQYPTRPQFCSLHSSQCSVAYPVEVDAILLLYMLPVGLHDQTFLTPLDEEELKSLLMPTEYGFVTNLYFLTQLSLYLGLHAAYEK